MKVKSLAVMAIFALLIQAAPQAAYAAPASMSAMLEDKLVYHTEESDYIAGDCVLTATRMMIRRAAILNNNNGWDDITNASLREKATSDGLLLSSFSYSDDGMTYKVSTGEFSGEGNSARIREFAELLEIHPEGVVVHGEFAAENGPHGVLVVAVRGNEVYAVDAATNTGDMNEGIQKLKDTIMLDPSLCTDYWYICDIKGGSGGAKSQESDRLPRFELPGPDIKLA